MKQRERKYLTERRQLKRWFDISRANVYKIDNIGNGTATAHHYNMKEYKIRCVTRIEDDTITFLFDKSDLRKLRNIPVPEIKLAPPSAITAEPYFKPQNI